MPLNESSTTKLDVTPKNEIEPSSTSTQLPISLDGNDNEEDPEEENPIPTGPGPPDDEDDIVEVEKLVRVLEKTDAFSYEMKKVCLPGRVWKYVPELSCVDVEWFVV